MPTLTTTYLTSVLAAREGPCVSICLPTHRSYPDVQQDHIRYKNLVRAAEEALASSHPTRDAKEVVNRLRPLQDDAMFWAEPADGAVVLASPARLDVFKLPRAVPERAEVGDTFHVKPLIRHVQSADRFHVLGVSRERAALFEGNRYQLSPLNAPGVPLTLADVIGREVEEPMPGSRMSGPGPAPRPGTRGGESVVGGEGRGSREVQLVADPREFYRAVDKAVLERVSNPAGLPVIVMGVEENLADFRAATKNRYVMASVEGDWTHWRLPEIRERAWKAFEKHYQTRLAAVTEDYGTAVSRKMGTADLVEAARAAAEGRIGTLLVDADRTLPGAIEFNTGAVRPAGPADARPGDMLDDLAELALTRGATVTIVPSEKMPTQTGLAAIYRY